MTDTALKTQSGYLTFIDTLKLMCTLIYDESKNAALRKKIISIGDGLAVINPSRETAEYYFKWVRDNIKYTMHAFDVQTLQTPEVTLSQMSGDCANMTILLGAIYRSLGFNVGVVGVNFGSVDFNHVYGVVALPEGYYFTDTTNKEGSFGQELLPELYTKKTILLFE